MVKSINRKPDYETESFRAWSSTKEEAQQYKNNNSFEIDMGKEKIQLIDFNKITKTNNDIIGYYKIRMDKKLIIFYSPEEVSKKDKEDFVNAIKKFSKVIDFNVEDMRETLIPSIKAEMKNLEKLGAKK